jgi:hypothetical protein
MTFIPTSASGRILGRAVYCLLAGVHMKFLNWVVVG